jgi:hypothetical protein
MNRGTDLNIAIENGSIGRLKEFLNAYREYETMGMK